MRNPLSYEKPLRNGTDVAKRGSTNAAGAVIITRAHSGMEWAAQRLVLLLGEVIEFRRVTSLLEQRC